MPIEPHYIRRKKVKEFLTKVEEQWGTTFDIDEFVFMERKEKIFMTSKEIEKVPFEKLRVNSVGIYIAEIKGPEVRLSIEASQMLGPKATKNVVELNEEEKIEWVTGQDLKKETDCRGFVIIKIKDDFFGTGKVKDGKILNFVPKTRRMKTVVPKQNKEDNCCQ